jgi:hypothetical protein
MVAISSYVKLIAGIVLAALVAFAFYETYQHGYGVAQSIGEKNLSDYKTQIAQANTAAATDAFGRYAADVTRGQAAESGFINVQTAGATRAEALKEQIDDVTQTPVVQSPRAAIQSAATVTPVYSCVFSRGFVRLWNAAADVADDSDRALQGSAGTGAPAGGPGPDATTDSGVSQADILDWFVDYANRAHGTEDKLKGVRAALPVSQ